MKNICLVLFAAALITSCSETSKQTNTSADEIPQTDTLAYTYKTVAKTEVNDKIKDTDALYKATITYPVITGGTALADSINKTLITAAFDNKPSVDAFVDSFITRSKDDMGEASFNGWFYEAIATVITNNPKVVTLQTDISSYTGGAHGSYATLYFNFGKDGKQLAWHDIIEPGKKDSLVLINESTLRVEREIPEGQSWQDAGFFVDSAHMPLPAMFALGKDGLGITYNQYEVAPYAMGITTYTIPYNKLNGIIKKEWLP